MTENGTATVELSDDELEQVENSDNVICVEEDFIIKANAVQKKAKENKSEDEATKKRALLEAYAKAKQEISENVEPDWNMKAIDAGKVIKYRANPKKEKNMKFEKGLQKKAVDSYIDSNNKVRVAVLDSGVDIVEGIDLAETINLVPEDQEITMMYQDMTGHGTSIASVIAGNNENGIQGVNDNVELCSVKVLDKNNQAPLSRIVEGIYWCIDNDINIINMSFGTSKKSVALEKAVKDAYDAGILMIAAAGNGGEEDAVEYPAAFEEVMAVASTNENAEISDFSNTGEELDVAAPGEKIPVTGFFGLSGITHGTSIATPHVTGVASLLWEKDLSKSHDFIRQLIEYSAKQIDGTDDCGLLDVDSAMANYDEFAETFEVLDNAGVDTNDVVAEAALEASVEENTEEPDTFEYVSDDEAYVEGRWNSGIANKTGHVDCLSNINGFSEQQKNMLKIGVIAPDDETTFGLHGDNPEWHGLYRNYEKNSAKELSNYIASYEIQTRIALQQDSPIKYMKSLLKSGSNRRGLNQTVYNRLVNGLYSSTKEKMKFGRVFFDDLSAELKKSSQFKDWQNNGLNANFTFSNNASNRKFFLYGAAIHNITDSMAHSSCLWWTFGSTSDWFKIQHDTKAGSIYKADEVSNYRGRFEIAKKLAYLAVVNLGMNYYGCYLDYYYAFSSLYNESSSDYKFKVAYLKKFAKDNCLAANEGFTSLHDKTFSKATCTPNETKGLLK